MFKDDQFYDQERVCGLLPLAYYRFRKILNKFGTVQNKSVVWNSQSSEYHAGFFQLTVLCNPNILQRYVSREKEMCKEVAESNLVLAEKVRQEKVPDKAFHVNVHILIFESFLKSEIIYLVSADVMLFSVYQSLFIMFVNNEYGIISMYAWPRQNFSNRTFSLEAEQYREDIWHKINTATYWTDK